MIALLTLICQACAYEITPWEGKTGALNKNLAGPLQGQNSGNLTSTKLSPVFSFGGGSSKPKEPALSNNIGSKPISINIINNKIIEKRLPLKGII